MLKIEPDPDRIPLQFIQSSTEQNRSWFLKNHFVISYPGSEGRYWAFEQEKGRICLVFACVTYFRVLLLDLRSKRILKNYLHQISGELVHSKPLGAQSSDISKIRLIYGVRIFTISNLFVGVPSVECSPDLFNFEGLLTTKSLLQDIIILSPTTQLDFVFAMQIAENG